jgi:hypothetical protein
MCSGKSAALFVAKVLLNGFDVDYNANASCDQLAFKQLLRIFDDTTSRNGRRSM